MPFGFTPRKAEGQQRVSRLPMPKPVIAAVPPAPKGDRDHGKEEEHQVDAAMTLEERTPRACYTADGL